MRAIAANEPALPHISAARAPRRREVDVHTMRGRVDLPVGPDPAAPEVLAVHSASRGRYGS